MHTVQIRLVILALIAATVTNIAALAQQTPSVWLVFGTSTHGGIVQSVQAIRYEAILTCADAISKMKFTPTDPTFRLTIPPHCTGKMPNWWLP